MASYTGHLIDSPHRAEDTLRCSESIQNYSITPVFPITTIDSFDPLVAGIKTYIQQGENETAYDGGKVDSFLDDYYYRIHISPAIIEFGSIVSPSEETFIVWNAYFVSKTCSSIDKTVDTEYTLDPDVSPFSLMPLEYETYTVSVEVEGAVTFDATVTFVFTGESPVLILSGTRVAVFPFAPSIPMMESLEWLTDIMTSKDGSEQRMSIRPIPRQGFKFDVVLKTEQEQARLDALMFLWAKRTWGVPIWGEMVEHNDNINIGDDTIYFDTTNADFRDDSYAIIWQSFDNYEAVQVETVASDSITLSKVVLNDWPGNKVIMPLRIGYMLSPSNLVYDADGLGKFNCGFIIRYNKLISTYSAPVSYGGLPVLDASLEKGGLELQTEADAKMTDFGLSDFTQFSDSDFNIYVQQHIFRKVGKAEIWKFRELLHSLYGRRGTCWIVSDKNDFEQTQIILAAETELTVKNVGWARNMQLNDLRTHLAFIYPSGAMIFREITGLTESGDEDIISLDSAPGVQIDPGDCTICMLDKCRLTEDKIDIEWQEPFRILSRINFTRVKA